MAGEHQHAQSALEKLLENARNESMDEDAYSRALMFQLIEYYQSKRPADDIISELEEHIRFLEDGGDSVITRGC